MTSERVVQITLPTLYDLQRRAFYHGNRIGVTEASTKAGKTVGALTWQADQVFGGGPYPHHWWVAPVYEQSKIAFGRAVRMFGQLPGVTYTITPMVISLANGHHWHFRSGEKADNLYGEDVGSAVIDEFTRLRHESYVAVTSTMTSTMGTMNLIGNVKGRGWGYKLAREAEQADDMTYTKITADDAVAAGVMDQAALDFAKKRLPHEIFRELYYCEPSDSSGNPFGMEQIRACVAELSGKPAVVYGVDLAKSSDFTVVWGVDEDGRCCFVQRWQNAPWNETASQVANIIGSTPAIVDGTGVGSAIVDFLQAAGHNVTPFVFTSTKKQELMGELRMAIQGGATSIPPEAVTEHEAFEYVVVMSNGRATGTRYEAPPGLHDDYVDAHALAVHGYNSIPRGEPYQMTSPVMTASSFSRSSRPIGW